MESSDRQTWWLFYRPVASARFGSLIGIEGQDFSWERSFIAFFRIEGGAKDEVLLMLDALRAENPSYEYVFKSDAELREHQVAYVRFTTNWTRAGYALEISDEDSPHTRATKRWNRAAAKLWASIEAMRGDSLDSTTGAWSAQKGRRIMPDWYERAPPELIGIHRKVLDIIDRVGSLGFDLCVWDSVYQAANAISELRTATHAASAQLQEIVEVFGAVNEAVITCELPLESEDQLASVIHASSYHELVLTIGRECVLSALRCLGIGFKEAKACLETMREELEAEGITLGAIPEYRSREVEDLFYKRFTPDHVAPYIERLTPKQLCVRFGIDKGWDRDSVGVYATKVKQELFRAWRAKYPSGTTPKATLAPEQAAETERREQERSLRPYRAREEKGILILAALTDHHKYEDQGDGAFIGNWLPITGRALADKAEVNPRDVTEYMQEHFDCQKGYERQCHNRALLRTLQKLRGEEPGRGLIGDVSGFGDEGEG